jgi:NAD-dependent dihydropyrimidine dehydrogenase PreA subunit
MDDHINQGKVKRILFCNCGGERIDKDRMAMVDQHLDNVSVEVTKLSDLCGLVAKRKDLITGLINTHTEYLIIGCYKRTMDLLLDQISKKTNEPFTFNHVNLIEESADEAIVKINSFCPPTSGNQVHHQIREDSGWPSWYPVIDYERCTACGQCADFCLFGVYEKSEDRVNVVNPEECKNNCPACARLCPSTAIIFPKYKNGGAIGGSEDINEQAEQQRMAQDIDSLLGNDIYAAIERRKAKRQSLVREEAMKKAFDERSEAMKGI